MKDHNKQYENVFSIDANLRYKLNLEQISIEDMSLEEYTLLFQDFLTSFYLDLFLSYVKLSWLRRRFTYFGEKTILPMYKNSPFISTHFVKFIRRVVGKDLQVVTRGRFFSIVESYFKDFFPDFETNNPFTNPEYYKFPYENISVEFLSVVRQLDDRIGLLKKANDKNMSYAVFLDYVINHVSVENDILGRDRYQILRNDRQSSFYVKDTDKKLTPIAGKKRKI